MNPNAPFREVARLEDFGESPFKVVQGGDRPILLIRETADRVRAVDNRCPHMGFPLDKGTIKDGVLVCHWHHARFDPASGCAFDLFADDIPAYDTRVENGAVLVASAPRNRPSTAYYFRRLRQGLEQNISIIQYKSVAGLLEAGAAAHATVREAARFGSRNHDKWSDGMTYLAMALNLQPWLQADTQVLALCKAIRQVALNCDGQPARRDRNALSGADASPERLERWFRRWSLSRHRDGAERVLLTAASQRGKPARRLSDFLFGALSDRVYADSGHSYDFANKLLELLEELGDDEAETLLPLIVRNVVEAIGEEDKGGWRSPVDLIPLARAAEERLAEIWPRRPTEPAPVPPDFRAAALGEDPKALLDRLLESVEGGCPPADLAREIAFAAAQRLAWFPESNDIADWFDPVHSFNFANAAQVALSRRESLQTARGLVHAALSVYQDRFLNIPKARLPDPSAETVAQWGRVEDPKKALLELVDRKQPWRVFAEAAVARFRASGDLAESVDCLAAAILREDVDFHKLQALEAAARQARLWGSSAEAEIILAGVARHTAAHAPTPRGVCKMVQIARRLQRGETLHDAEDPEPAV